MIVRSRLGSLAALAVLAGPVASLAWSQVTPARPIVLVVPFAAGRPTDLVARAAPDGTTLLIHHKGMATAPALYRQLPYDPLTDFEFVGQVVDVPMTLIGRKGLPAKSLPELLIYLKSRGDKVNLAHAGLGAVSHLCGMLYRQAVGVDLTTVAYQGTSPARDPLFRARMAKLGAEIVPDAKLTPESPSSWLKQQTERCGAGDQVGRGRRRLSGPGAARCPAPPCCAPYCGRRVCKTTENNI